MFKKYQCRYFDSRGRALKPACSQGDSCRFVHPEDANWPGLKPVDKHNNFVPPAPRKASGSVGWGKSRVSPKEKANSPDHHSERRSAPLVSQNDLFQQCKTEADENSRDNQSQSWNRRDCDDDQSQNRAMGRAMKSDKEARTRNSSSMSSSKRYDTRNYPGEQPEENSTKVSANRSQEVYAKSRANVPPLKAETRDSSTLRNSSPSYGERLDKKNVSPSSKSSSSHVPIAPRGFDGAKERTSRVLELFRDLSRLCHQATQDLGDQAKEERKVKAYTKLASTLSEVSGTTANPVMPALADILLKHAQCKQRVEANMKTMASVWEEAFDTFVVEISQAIDVKLEAAVRTVHQEIDGVRSMRGTSSSRSLKRQRSEHLRSTSSAEDGVESNDTGREYKRRRYDVPAQKRVQSDIQDILMQMKVKIDEQAECLEMLTRENKELRVQV